MNNLSPTQLLLAAVRATPRVAAGEKQIVYEVPEFGPVPDPVCWLCGGATAGRGRLVREVINKDTFTDTPRARALDSGSICSGCALVFAYHKPMRNYGILASPAGLRHPARTEWREILQAPPAPPFVACLTVSGQKYLVFKASVNWSRERFEALLEETPVVVVPERLAADLAAVEALYRHFTKEEIRTGSYRPYRILKCGLAEWEELEHRVEPLRWQARWFDLLLHVARRTEPAEAVADERESPVQEALFRDAARG